jgi:hypothetical protein
MREMTLLRSPQARQILLLQKGAHQEVREVSALGQKPTGVLCDTMLSLSCPWVGQVWTHSLLGWLIRKRPSLQGALRTNKFQ